MRYVLSKAKQQAEDMTYRIYLTDSLKCIAYNTMRYAGGQSISKRYIDIINPMPEETRTSEEIIEDIRIKLKLLGE